MDDKIYISWEEFHQDVKNLCKKIKDSGQEFNKIVAISRGGFIPAGIVAYELGIRNSAVINISTYVGSKHLKLNEVDHPDSVGKVDEKTAKKLKPKIVILENVKGLIIGNAKKYATEIIRQFKEIGYETQVFLLNSKYMDVPQARERVFFIANNQKYPKLKLNFNEKIITYRENDLDLLMSIRNGETVKFDLMSEMLFVWSKKWIGENG